MLTNIKHSTSIFDARLKIHPLSVAKTESDRGEIWIKLEMRNDKC